MKIGWIKYNDTRSDSLGIHVSGKGTYNAAEIDVSSYSIPGRSGDVIIPNGRYKNIEVTYPAFAPSDFEARVQAIRNWMRSAAGYRRIEDNYDTEHFRMGIAKKVLTFSTSQLNRGANFQLVFDCKPQRYLKTGETPAQAGEWGTTIVARGNRLTFNYPNSGGGFKDMTIFIQPVQSGSGVPSLSNVRPISGRTYVNLFIYPAYDQSAIPTITAELGRTVYGGEFDVISGVLTVTHQLVTANTRAMNNTEEAPGWKGIGVINIIGQRLVQEFSTQINVGTMIGINTDGTDLMYLPLSAYGLTQSEWRMLEQDVQVVLPIARPYRITLPGNQISVMNGANCVWTNTADVRIEYGEKPGTLANPTIFDARPIVKVTNPAPGATVSIGRGTMSCANGYAGEVTIDSEQMNIYSGETNLNGEWEGDFPVLSPGVNTVAFTGCDSVSIIPNWWEL